MLYLGLNEDLEIGSDIMSDRIVRSYDGWNLVRHGDGSMEIVNVPWARQSAHPVLKLRVWHEGARTLLDVTIDPNNVRTNDLSLTEAAGLRDALDAAVRTARQIKDDIYNDRLLGEGDLRR